MTMGLTQGLFLRRLAGWRAAAGHTLVTVRISRRSGQEFVSFAERRGTVRTIQGVYEAHGFALPVGFEPSKTSARRSVCAAAEAGIDLSDAMVNERLLGVYRDAIDDWGRRHGGIYALPNHAHKNSLEPWARALLRSLQRDGAPLDDDAQRVLGGPLPVLAIERFDRLGEPQVLLDHLARIDAGIAVDSAAAMSSAKELVESVLKFVLDDYGVFYARNATLTDLYKLVSSELRLSRESVPESVKGSAAAQKMLQNLATAVQNLAELRNELGLGHGRTSASPARARHARLAANAARAVAEFVLETWHERKLQGPSTT